MDQVPSLKTFCALKWKVPKKGSDELEKVPKDVVEYAQECKYLCDGEVWVCRLIRGEFEKEYIYEFFTDFVNGMEYDGIFEKEKEEWCKKTCDLCDIIFRQYPELAKYEEFPLSLYRLNHRIAQYEEEIPNLKKYKQNWFSGPLQFGWSMWIYSWLKEEFNFE